MNSIFTCKRLFNLKICAFRAPKNYNGFLKENPSLLLLTVTPRRVFSSKSSKDNVFTTSYLINSCGLSPESAKSVSGYLHLKSSQRADTVITFFSNLGFNKKQISKMIQRFPQVLLYIDPEKRLKPKIEFLNSIGLSRTELAGAISAHPHILGRSLERQTVPCFEFLKGLLCSNEKVISAVKLFPDILRTDNRNRLVTNVSILQQHYRVPQSNIVLLLTHMTKVITLKPDHFKAIADSVLDWGVNPLKSGFVVGIYVKGIMSKSTWERKINTYKKLGWSEEEIRQAFVKEAWCMLHSEEKVRDAMDLLVNKTGWEPSHIAQSPKVLGLSLRKRIIPRCSVIQSLFSKGLISRSVKVSAVFYPCEKAFLNKFVVPYVREASCLLKLYQEQMELSEQPENS